MLSRLTPRAFSFAKNIKSSSLSVSKGLVSKKKPASLASKLRKPLVIAYAPSPLPYRITRSVITLSEEDEDKAVFVSDTKDLRGQNDSMEVLTGVPKTQLRRNVIIYKPTPRTVQQGTKHTLVYMKFRRQTNRTTENLMGWTATPDPTGNLTLSFPDESAAIAFAQRNGFEYDVQIHEGQAKVRTPKDYSVNFKFKDPRKHHPETIDF